MIFEALFGAKPAEIPGERLDMLRAAIAEKNRQWHQRYRTVDGYNVPRRAVEAEVRVGEPGKEITNYEVMQQEMSQREVLTANRDPLRLAPRLRQAYKVDDSNLPHVDGPCRRTSPTRPRQSIRRPPSRA